MTMRSAFRVKGPQQVAWVAGRFESGYIDRTRRPQTSTIFHVGAWRGSVVPFIVGRALTLFAARVQYQLRAEWLSPPRRVSDRRPSRLVVYESLKDEYRRVGLRH